MKLANWLIVAVVTVGSISALSSRAATVPASKGALVQSLHADVEAFRTAVQSRDKAAAVTAFKKVLEDFRALPSAIRQRIVQTHPAIARIVQSMKALRGDATAIRSARQSPDKAAVAEAVAKLKADLAAAPPGLRMVIVATHPALARLVG
jgi:2-oxo-4-hydroxy-4-carboxy--5-ureidoimidazoline (OHCU) decarboxylase